MEMPNVNKTQKEMKTGKAKQWFAYASVWCPAMQEHDFGFFLLGLMAFWY